MSFWSRPRNIAIIGGVAVAAFFIPTKANPSTNPFETPGTKNIADRFSAGGGSDVHTPGVATPRGKSEQTESHQTSPSGIKSAEFQEHQAAQRPGEPGMFDKAWNKSHYGTEKGK